jgi:hypothetical protein
MGNDAALAEEAPLTLQSFPFWALFIVIFAVVTAVASVLIAATNLLSSREAPSVADEKRDRDQVRERTRPNAVKHLLAFPPART